MTSGVAILAGSANSANLDAIRARLFLPLAFVICGALVSGPVRGQTTPWNTNGSGIWYAPSGTDVGIGTASPLAPLDVNGTSYKLSTSSAVKELQLSFPNNIANQKIDLYLAGTQTFGGVLDVEVTDAYAWQAAFGTLHKRFYLGFNPNGAIFVNQSRVIDEGGAVADNYAISDFIWDGTNYKITLAHRVSTGNHPRVRVTAYACQGCGSSTVLNFSATDPYTTDTTVYPRPYINFNNNVGIGTSAPATTLDVVGTGAQIYQNNANQSYPLLLRNNMQKDGSGQYLGLLMQSNDGANSVSASFAFFSNPSASGRYLRIGAYDNQSFTWTNVSLQGNIGIGTTTPQYPLSVNGTVQAKEVIVSTGWSDYVFGPRYRLMPLAEIAEYIDRNHHLPDIPSAADVEAKGVSLGDMQAKLLAKIEELTLHLIQAEKRISQLEEKNPSLADRSGAGK